MSERSKGQHIAAVRQFNRFYTQRIGVLNERLVSSRFSLIEVRILYELANRSNATATELVSDLNLDPGYVSRILRGFKRQALIDRTKSKTDGRQKLLSLTRAGRRTFASLNSRSNDEV